MSGTSRFRGCFVALVTPFRRDGQVDYERLEALVDFQLEAGMDGLVPCGTTGESATLHPEEQREIIRRVVERVRGRAPVIAGAGTNATEEAVELARHAERAGADAVLSVTPYYNRPTQEGLYQHFRAIAESVRLPVILYNVPSRTGCNLEVKTVLRLAEIPNIIGIKEASGNLEQIMELLRVRPQGFLVLSGDDAWTLPVLALGGDGVISVIANQTPAEMRELVAAALAGDWARARELHYRLLPLMRGNFLETNPIPVKAALAMMGLIEENYRLPLVPPRPETRERLRQILADLNLIPAGAGHGAHAAQS
ncbi:4-hydroxy-tetrahydrodipicolinate synthase [bacterium HR08]|nr:4-hydroxy-tetrahydrodipicolinate synthase [bacterium HR08]